jgi:uncharacterized protein (DUF362 family)
MINPAKVWVGCFGPATARDDFRIVVDRFLKPESKPIRTIAIKINLCEYRRAETGSTTDPVLLGALLDVLHERFPSASLTIVENDATSLEIWAAYRLLGFEKVAKEHNAGLHNVAEGEWETVSVPGARVFPELEVPEIIRSSDLFINFAKLKTNALTKTTGCLKNIFAFLRMKRKVTLHGRIDDVLLDMNKVIVPHLCLIDGYIGMEGMGGPAFGVPKRCNLLVAGTNPVATDSCSVRIMGFRPLSIKHIKLCYRAGLGPVKHELETNIENFDYRDYKFRFETWDYWLRNLLRRRAGFTT